MSGTQNKDLVTLADQRAVAAFVASGIESVTQSGLVLDSAGAAAAATNVMQSVRNEPGASLPRPIAELLSSIDDETGNKVIKSVFDGVRTFEREHGFQPGADLLVAALAQGKAVFDSVTNAHHDQISINPNAPIVAILGAIAEACPFAGYLPADKGSNEARLIIVSHQAGSDFGGYSAGDLMDGIEQGRPYLGAGRTLELSAPNDATAYKFAFTTQLTAGDPVPLLRGRTIIYANGMVAALETQNGPSSAAQVAINGHIKIAGTDYALAGTVKPATGEVSITPTPAFPVGTVVQAEAFVDYERAPQLAPELSVHAEAYQLWATPYRGLFTVTPEARSQFANEVGVDAASEAMLTMRGQYATERHYLALQKARNLGKWINHVQFDYNYDAQIQQKTRSQIWQDFSSVVGVVSQVMAEQTADHGITHMYVGKNLLAQFNTMGAPLFVPSGIEDRPGIFRAGRLFGKYEVYYSPSVQESADGTSAEIICVGRSTQTARCPIIFGDASAPMFEPMGINRDMQSGYIYHARSFTSQNPHEMSARVAP